MGVGRLVLGAVKYLASPESRMAYRAHRTDGWTTRKAALQTLSLPKAERDMVIFANTEQMGMGRFHILHDAPEPLIDSHLNDPWSSISDADQAPLAPQHLIDPGFRPLFDAGQSPQPVTSSRGKRYEAGTGLFLVDNARSFLVDAGGGLGRFPHSIFDAARSTPWYVNRFKLALGADMVTGPNISEPGPGKFRISRRGVGNRPSAARKEWLSVATWYLYGPIAPLVKGLVAEVRNLFRRSS